jgi:hypothetical protein
MPPLKHVNRSSVELKEIEAIFIHSSIHPSITSKPHYRPPAPAASGSIHWDSTLNQQGGYRVSFLREVVELFVDPWD